MKKLITGNEALAWGALQAGVKVVAGYPGTPSTEATAMLLAMKRPGIYVEWSTNEKVAFEVAAAAAWAGQRALCTMKMSGLNVAYDSLISVAYSGCEGGFVIYVADDPGASAGMCEQDSRGFALMSDMVMLEPTCTQEVYGITQYAFELSEAIKSPVFIRLVTATAHAYAEVDVEEPAPSPETEARLIHDIERFTKAGARIVLTQHHAMIERLEKAASLIEAKGLNELNLSAQPGKLGIIAAGATVAYLDEAFDALETYQVKRDSLSILKIRSTHPFPTERVHTLLQHCQTILVLEELEPYLERGVYVEAQKIHYSGKIIGKLNGAFSRVGEYGAKQVLHGVSAALQIDLPAELFHSSAEDAEQLAASRPITVCAGCPHRGTFMALNKAIQRSRLKKENVMVTGDIGCTILGMNPPFNTVSTEVSMGSSIGLAQGYVHAGIKTPVVATIGDATFFHAGIPSLINAIQHEVNLTVIIMDNRWTAMTGMQVNPGTPCGLQGLGCVEVDIARIIPALGVEQFFTMDPFDFSRSVEVIQQALALPGVKVVLARQECAIQAQRRGLSAGKITIVPENCNLCKLCVMLTGCAALSPGKTCIEIDPDLCYGCGMCVQSCNRKALIKEPAA